MYGLESQMPLCSSGEEEKGGFSVSLTLPLCSVAFRPMHVCMCVCFYLRIYVCMYICMILCMCVCICQPVCWSIPPSIGLSASLSHLLALSPHFCLVTLKLLVFPVGMNNEAFFSPHPQYVNLSPEWTVQIGSLN